ncbi:MAG: glycine oxidase ThiO [Gemmatimonadales bacterium]|nr:MAG: glycine oxidase ThiO [Gemmatimonadales bacterium]
MHPTRNRFDLVVVGAGVIGLAVARAARANHLSVLVLERGSAGRGASWAAAGMLSPLGEALEPGPFLRFGLRSLDLWSDFARGLEDETGEGVEYRECGKLRLALSPQEEGRLRRRLAWAREHRVPARWLDAHEVMAHHPGLAPGLRGALLLERDFRVDNRRLVQALRIACVSRGVELREGCEVTSLLTGNGRAHGVRLSTGQRLEAGRVLVAAGAWSGRIGGLPHPLPVRPIRGEMAALRPASRGDEPSVHRGGHGSGGPVLESERLYLVPRDDGRLLVGATETDAGFEAGPTVGGIRHILSEAVAMLPALATATVEEVWSGFRPGSPDGMPILGPVPGVGDLFVATGHYRNGILLTPATAEGLGALVSGQDAPYLPEAFRPDRLRGSDGSGA